MNYLSVVNLVFGILFGVLGLLTVHFAFFAVVGIFKKKTFPRTETKLKYGIIIPARNEEKVVCHLIESVQKSNYPADKLHVFVIAHNCTDRTAEIARATGATVYEYNNPNERTMGYAFRYLFDCIRRDFGTENYDGFFLFNADDVVCEDYFDRMNDAFVAHDKKAVVTSFRNSKNFGYNLMTALYGLFFAYGCRFESRGRTACGCSTRVQGTGYVINSDLVKNGWTYVTLTEDWEFTRDQVLRDTPIVYCDDAVFYDEQPTSFRVMWRQRIRWSRGHLLVCLSGYGNVLKALFLPHGKGGARKKGSVYDIAINISPICIISAFASLLNFVLIAISPLFGAPVEVAYRGYLVSALRSLATSYLAIAAASVVLYVTERRRIHSVSLPLRIASVLVSPLFFGLTLVCEVAALFVRNLEWKPIPHNDAADIDTVKERHLPGKDRSAVTEPAQISDTSEKAKESEHPSTSCGNVR